MPTIDYTQSRAVVAGIQRRLDHTVAEIRSNKSLTDAGRRREIARATIEAKQQAAKQKADFVKQREQRREGMERIAFGTTETPNSADLTAIRDARDRARKLQNAKDAQAMLNDAILHNDESLAQAVAAHAHSRHWREVVQHYGHTFDQQTYIDLLDEIPSGPNTNTSDSIVFAIRNPRELGTASEHELEQIANRDVTNVAG